MLSDPTRELIAAFVDGRLGPRQQLAAQKLLQTSAEARRLLERLQNDSKTLSRYTVPPLNRDLAPAILQKIAARRLAPVRRIRRSASASAYPVWVGFAAAAALIFAVGAASYCYFAASLDRPAAVTLAHNQNHPPVAVPDGKVPDEIRNDVASTPSPEPEEKDKVDQAAHPEEGVARQKPADVKPSTTVEKDDPIFTSEGMEMFTELKSVVPSLDLPAAFKLRELQQDAARKKLVDELQKDAAVRLELPVPDGSRAFERLQAILKAHHVDLMIDASAQRRLQRPLWKTNYVLYSEGMTAAELATLLQQIGTDKHPTDNPFDHLVVRRITERDHKELSDLLGVDPMQTQPSKGTGPLGVDPSKPISDRTAAQVAASLAQGKAGAKANEHTMLAMPYNPVRPHRDSAEVKRFLDERKPLGSGALQVLLVLRGSAG